MMGIGTAIKSDKTPRFLNILRTRNTSAPARVRICNPPVVVSAPARQQSGIRNLLVLNSLRQLVCLLFLCWGPPWLPMVALATNYYVATNGVDTDPGTLTKPFRNIQRAANVMVAGDTCNIRGGTYRETVIPVNSGLATQPITFQPFGSETVIISGADVVTGWNVSAGSIYEASFTGALGDKDQVFVDGVMMNLARWPDASLDVSRPAKASAAGGTFVLNANGTYSGTYTDSHLTKPAGFFNGAKIHFVPGVKWVAQTGIVTSYSPGTLQFNWQLSGTDDTYTPKAGDPYFLFGLLSLLDTPGEWFIDAAANTLYLWSPQNDSPSNHTVEAKRRDYGFNLADRSYITLEGLRLFACAVNTSSGSQHLMLDNLNCLYVSHFSLIDTANMWDYHMEDTGIILSGTNNTLSNSEIAFSAGNGVTVLGASNLVDNCVIHDVDYADLDCGAINTGKSASTSNGHLIRNNTCYNSGRGLLLIRALTSGKVAHNILFRPMLGTTDGGALYTFGHDGRNTEIAYNRVSDSVCAGGGSGIYLDNVSTNFIAHHNLIYNTSYALHYNLSSVNMKWFNNTAVAFNNSFMGAFTGSQTNTEVRNNIFTAAFNLATTNPAEVSFSNNLTNTVNPLFASTNALDFRVQSNSPAVNAGIIISPYTDGYSGVAPDVGAFEFGQTPWSAGSTLAAVPPAGPTELVAAVITNGIQLTWTDNSTNEAEFVIERSFDNQSFSELVHLPPNTTNYSDPLLHKGFTYYYRVRAGESPNSNYRATVVPGRDPFAGIQAESLDAQIGLNVTTAGIGSCDAGDWAKYSGVDFGSGATNITLFLANGQALTNLYLEVRLDGTNGTRVANINILGTGGWNTYRTVSSSIALVTGVHDLFFTFKGGYGVCDIDYFSFGATSPALLQAPAVPQTVTANCVSVGQVRVTWSATNGGQDGFRLERSTDAQRFLEIASVAGTNAFDDPGLTSGTTYYYRLRGYNKLGFSDYSTVAVTTTWTPKQVWRFQYFGTISNTNNAADTADPDGDGLVNFLEYAFGRNPMNSDAKGVVTGQIDASGKLQIAFLRARAELTYVVQSSGDLVNWTNIITNPGAIGQNVIVSDDPPAGTQRRFMRVWVP